MISNKLSGIVICGENRGKGLGYPTANFMPSVQVEEGIYVSEAKIAEFEKIEAGDGEVWLPAVTFVGASETFGETDIKVETYILDFDESIYGMRLTVRLLNKIRGNKKFDSVEKLVEQIKKDVANAREYFSND